jgi:murein DD-endopeptidase MepM/ murein hydrolase activator NlpD
MTWPDEESPHSIPVRMPAAAVPIDSDFHSRFGVTGIPREKSIPSGVIVGAVLEHQGIDMRAPRGYPVIAAADGVAQRAKAPYGGNLVLLEHRGSQGAWIYRTLYSHLDRVLVRSGERVRRGDLIGAVGSSGKGATVPHLHFEVGDCCRIVNPHERWYDGDGRVSLFDPRSGYADKPDRLVYPLPGRSDLGHYFGEAIDGNEGTDSLPGR